MRKYIVKSISSLAVFMPAEEGGYNVSFPAYPGCVTFGRTIEDAQKMAKEVLELWFEELSANKIKISMQNPIFSEIKTSFV